MFEKINKFDIRISERIRMDHGESRWWKYITFFAHSGDSWFWLIGLLVFWLVLAEWRTLTAFLITAILGLAAVVMVLKFAVRRRRPPGKWSSAYRNTDPHSFPSGHAARASMLAVIAILIGPPWAAVLMVFWAVMVSLSRVLTGMHYFSDVFAGVMLGIMAGQFSVLLRPLLSALLPAIF